MILAKYLLLIYISFCSVFVFEIKLSFFIREINFSYNSIHESSKYEMLDNITKINSN